MLSYMASMADVSEELSFLYSSEFCVNSFRYKFGLKKALFIHPWWASLGSQGLSRSRTILTKILFASSVAPPVSPPSMYM